MSKAWWASGLSHNGGAVHGSCLSVGILSSCRICHRRHSLPHDDLAHATLSRPSQRLAQERARRERLFGEFIDQASQLYADALSHTALEDPARLVPLYATIGKLRLFASERTIAAADAVMVRIVATYYLPNVDFTSRPSPPAGTPTFWGFDCCGISPRHAALSCQVTPTPA